MHAADLLSTRAYLTPDREALVYLHTGERFTYRQLNARANRLANFLRERLGVQKGDRVSILAHNSPVYIDLFYGLAKIGAIFAPLNWRLTASELAYIVNDCEPSVLICGSEFTGTLAELLPQVRVAHLVSVEGAEIPSAGDQVTAVIARSVLSGVRRRLPDAVEGGAEAIPRIAGDCFASCLATAQDAPRNDGRTVLSYEAELARASDAEPPQPPLDGDDPHCILYTSGTMGKPKGAVIPQRQTLWNCINTAASWGLSDRDVAPVFTPLFHAGAWGAFLINLFYTGGRIVLARTFDPEASLRAIVEERCTVILGVPKLFQMWYNSPYFAEADFSHVHFFINGGASCPIPLMEAWRKAKGVIFRQGYGLTEVGPNCFTMTDEESAPKSGSVGKPIFHSRMRLVDPETFQDVPVGQTGELLISGPCVCLGYWRNPEATAAAIRDGWFHTGDMARMDEDGFFYIAGRYKDMIKSGGENVYAAEVEAVFRQHPAVADAALIGQPDEKWGEVGLMIVSLKPGQAATDQELLAFCQGKLAKFKIPKRVVLVDALPYSPYGKVEKARLREKFVIRDP